MKVILKKDIGLFKKGVEYNVVEKVGVMWRIQYEENSSFKIRVAPFDIEKYIE